MQAIGRQEEVKRDLAVLVFVLAPLAIAAQASPGQRKPAFLLVSAGIR